MNRAEQRRIIVLNHLEAGALINGAASELLGISKRQLQRLHKAYREEGVAGLVHGNRGRPAYNAVDAEVAARVVELARDKYTGFNHKHLTEMLAENRGIELSRPTLRRILLLLPLKSASSFSEGEPDDGFAFRLWRRNRSTFKNEWRGGERPGRRLYSGWTRRLGRLAN